MHRRHRTLIHPPSLRQYYPTFWKKQDDTTWSLIEDIKPPRFLLELAQPAFAVDMTSEVARKKHFQKPPRKPGLGGLVGSLKDGGGGVTDALKKGVGGALDVGAGAAVGAGVGLAVADSDAVDAVKSIDLSSVGGFMKGAADSVKDIAKDVGAAISGVVGDAADKAGDAVGTVADKAGDVADGAVELAENAAEAVGLK